MDASPFTPDATGTRSATSTPTSGATALAIASANQQVLVTNIAAVPVFIAFGDSTVSATTSSGCPVAAGGARLFTVGPGVTHVAVVSATTAAAATYFTSGHGA